MQKRIILNTNQIEIVLQRLVIQLLENHGDFTNTVIIGLQPRGISLAKLIHNRLEKRLNGSKILFGELDSTFYRDDFRRSDKPLIPSTISLNFLIENKRVVIVDDVLYTGRSVRSALNALADFGRPIKTELLTLIDRRFNRELPIQPDYVGTEVDSRANDKVIVDLETENKVWIITEHDKTV
jgi:pyrimidine operon attenuation protein / uracil phosphoribosyltransferase